jgi:hypothetical protein
VPDPFARKTYLHAVPDEVLPVRFSVGKRLRALQVQAFVKGLDEIAEGFMGRAEGLELIVLSASDWRRQLSAPYGWGLARRSETGVNVALPAGYTPRQIARWDAVRLQAARAGVRAPGSVTAFLDALLGLEWAHARLLAQGQGKRPGAYLRELSACYLYQRVLQQNQGLLATLHAWARLSAAGVAASPDDDLPTRPQDFVYPRARMPLDRLLVTQSALWLAAADLTEAEGWELSPPQVEVWGRKWFSGRSAPL